jgi:DNA-binding CsgD family transcriptional regulator
LREAHGRNRFADNGFYLFKRPRDGAYWRVMNIPMGVCVAERREEVEGEGTRADAAARVARLNRGQLDVLRLVDQHVSSKEIGVRLGISPHTVDQRIRTAIRLLEVSRRQEAARLVSLAEPYQRLIH